MLGQQRIFVVNLTMNPRYGLPSHLTANVCNNSLAESLCLFSRFIVEHFKTMTEVDTNVGL